ncbi:6-pyruvoyl-tetrahydropterin synthase-related protein [Clostridium autoethanogenum]|uniref:6-pyruvoyl-tetrahydropterin synthase-related protein n=2 Tax=Clostridium autoethanogenum TaxID=84023 RepID=UPI00073A248E|nr:6-pyruvoyl-tetrahydropterin synthase-related protein [Clostridium autoethanogenum]ALU36824.1 6-pyruvoyl tetrahydrobiopterin synthase [Clostridium autoethanogenum DSM 10061]OVY50486.1 6-pyruvoyl-tetrahydropterin synthase related domain membrane protein [Clostridium autoethanogenum]
MKFQGYKYKFKINISHSVLINNRRGNLHSHTFEISLFIKIINDDFALYDDVEKIVQEFLNIYDEKELNLIKPFDKIEPTIENVGDFLYVRLKGILKNNNMILIRLEISETPARVYVVNYDENHIKEPGYEKEFKSYKKRMTRIIINNILNTTAKQLTDDLKNSSNTIVEGTWIQEDDKKEKVIEKKNTIKIKESKKAPDDIGHSGKVRKNNYVFLEILGAISVLLIGTIVLLLCIIKTGGYPWGADTYGHIFKGDLLYKSIKEGNIYPLFTQFWYNGVQPFRYWGPLSYYVLAGCEFISGGNPINGYVIFIGYSFFIGGLGWLLWGIHQRRILLSLVFGILWFFLPENIRVLFVAGNIPRVIIAALIPYLFYFVWKFVKDDDRSSIIPIALFMCAIIMCHLMIGAMVGIASFIFLSLYSIMNKKIEKSVHVILTMLLSFAICGIWIYPALKGGLVSMDSGATSSQMMELLATPFTISLNPFLRLFGIVDREYFYYGLSILIISILGIFVSNKKSAPGFVTSIVIFLGTTTAFVPMLEKMPFSQLLWMVRFTPIAYALFIISLLNWTKCKKYFMIIMVVLIAADSSLSFNLSLYPQIKSAEVDNILSSAKNITKQRIALLDDSTFGAYPSFYICSEDKKISYSYGWAWQGAATAQNIVLLNTALEKGYYNYMFDRSLEMGCDTVVVAKAPMKKDKRDFNIINNAAKFSQYTLYKETSEGYVFHRKASENFGVVTKYSGLCIGRSASDIPLEYPSFEIGSSWNIEDYTLDELSKYKVIYLSDFRYNSRSKAENMVSKLSSMGIKIIIDMNRIPADTITNRMVFLGVTAQPITFNTKMPDMFFNDKKYESVNFKDEYKRWNTVYLDNVPQVTGFSWVNGKKVPFLGNGKERNKNVTFLGFNLIFHGMENDDSRVLAIMNTVMGTKSSILPKRVLVPINLKYGQNSITINSPKNNVNTTVAFLDAYKSNSGEIYAKQNLLNVNKGETKIRVTYPYLFQGIAVSVIGLLGFAFFIIYIYKRVV